jgi:flavin reductase (DIM6/NTAB) family NADH-FMN oxidoreductase RutF
VTVLEFGADPERRRRLLWALPQGLYALGTADGAGAFHLMTASLVMQAAVDPCVLALAVESAARTRELLEGRGSGALSVLGRGQRELVRRFVKPQLDVELDGDGRPTAIAGTPVASSPGGFPVVLGALGALELSVREARGLGSHTLFLCDVGAVAVDPSVLEGPASAHLAEVLRMEDTRLNYGG